MKIKNRINMKLTAFLLFVLSNTLFAAETEAGGYDLQSIMKIMAIVTLIFIILIVWLALVYSEKEDSEGKLFLAPLKKFKDYMTMMKPVEEEKEILMDHDYDGIKELDNRVPPWFNLLFYGTMLFAIIYMLDYHVFGSGNVQADEYKAEMKQAELQRQILIETGAFINEETVKRLDDPGALSSGKEIFLNNCATCHGREGGGLVGPNLTDQFWIHGGGIKNVFKIIKYGVPQKGMISWQNQLSPKKMQEVASYILSLKGTNPPNGKEPEGQKYEPEENKDNGS